MSEPVNEYSPLHPHEPGIPPALDAEGRCLVCHLMVERDEARQGMPDGARLLPWSFIVEGTLDYGNNEEHEFALWIGTGWWCAGCLSVIPRLFTDDQHTGWPHLASAPNGLRVVIAHKPVGRVVRRPLCPVLRAERKRQYR